MKMLALLIMVSGAFVIYGARMFANIYNFAEKIIVNNLADFSDEELKNCRFTKSVARVRIVGFLIVFAGTLLLYYLCR